MTNVNDYANHRVYHRANKQVVDLYKERPVYEQFELAEFQEKLRKRVKLLCGIN